MITKSLETEINLPSTAAHNPNQRFSRAPDTILLPGSPTRPQAINVTDQSITLAWKKPEEGFGPEKIGSSPIEGYILEYFSPELQSGWVNAANNVKGDVYTVKNLKPDTRYVFIVRAGNSHGIGRPSLASIPIRTLSNDKDIFLPDHFIPKARQKLSLTEVSTNIPTIFQSTASFCVSLRENH